MLSLRIEDKYTGVTILDMEPLLELGDCPIEVRWENTKAEVRLLRKCEGREVTLVVPNLIAMERAASTLGLNFVVERSLVLNGLHSLNKPDGHWREFTTQTGPYLSRGLVMRAFAHKLRQGIDHQPLRKVLIESVLDNTSPVDADVLLGLRIKGARV